MKPIVNKVIAFVEEHKLFDKNQTIIIGVSGGADSIALLSILNNEGYKCVAAHCNFHLRGEESDRDMLFVTDYCNQNNIELVTTHFKTEEYAKEKHISIEMAARDLRYTWFHNLLAEYNTNVLAIAHHSDDVIETFFINLLRGTGLHGLTGIKPKNGEIVRPLLCLSRSEILDYLSETHQSFVTDSSNNTNDYLRNKIRNVVIPEFVKASPTAKKTILKTIKNLRASEIYQDSEIEKIRENVEIKKTEVTKYDLSSIVTSSNCKLLLFELLRPYNASEVIIQSILESGLQSSGLVFYTNGYKLIKSRQFLEVIPNESAPFNESYYIEEINKVAHLPIPMQFEVIGIEKLEIVKDKTHCYLDMSKLEFPLRIRHWAEGDFFVPFGKNNRKKLSDFFINEKMSLQEKEQCLLLTNANNDIIWVIGRRADNRFKVTEKTETVLQITI